MSKRINKLLVIGHKGGAYKQAPDNTIKAFKKAIEFGGDYIEIDVRRSKDGNYVIMHDSDIFNATNTHGIVEEMTLNELKNYDCGEGEKIPTLDEVIKLAKNKINLMCELKTKNLAKGLIEILEKENTVESTIFVSFFIDELLQVQNINPNLIIGAIMPSTEEYVPKWPQRKEMIDYITQKGFSYLLTRFKNVNIQFINYCHENNLKVIVYPIKSKINIRRYINWGVDGIIVKNIAQAKDVLNE